MPPTIELEADAATGLELPSARAAAPPGQRYTLRPDDQPVLTLRASVPETEAERFIADALHDIRVFMQEHHVTAAGPPFSICRPHGTTVDIEAGWPTATNAPAGTSRIHSGSLPRSLTGPRPRPNPIDEAERRRYALQP